MSRPDPYTSIRTESPAPAVGLIRLERSETLNALNQAVEREVLAAALAFDTDRDGRAGLPGYRGYVRRLGPARAATHAADRGRRRVRAGRWLRVGHALRHPDRRGHRRIRPARDQAGYPARNRGDTADRPGRRQSESDGPGPDRADDGRPRGRASGPGQPNRAGGRHARRGARRGRDDRGHVETGRRGRDRGRGPSLRNRPDRRGALRTGSVRGRFATADRTEGMAAFLNKRQARFTDR